MTSSNLYTVLKSFRDYVESNGKFLADYLANQEVNFPQEVRGGEGGQAKTAKMPMDWPEKLKPLSGGDLGSRKDYGSGGGNKTSSAKSGDQYLHKDTDGAYKDGVARHPYNDSPSATDHEGYDIEKMPMDNEEEMENPEEEMKMEHEDEMSEDEMSEDEDKAIKSVVNQIKSLVSNQSRFQKQLQKQWSDTRRMALYKQKEEALAVSIAKQVQLELKNLGIEKAITPGGSVIVSKTVEIPTESIIIQKGMMPTLGEPDKASFDKIRLSDTMNMPVEDISDFNAQVNALSKKTDVNDLKDAFNMLNNMMDAGKGKNMGIVNYLNKKDYSGMNMQKKNSTVRSA